MARLFLLVATLGLAGCIFDDCQFSGPDTYVNESAALEVQMPSAGDTLTVAFVQADGPTYDQLQGFVAPDQARNPTPSTDQTVRLAFDQESALFGDREPYQIDAVAVGDTLYVYIVGSLDPSLWAQVCSPSEPAGVNVHIQSVSAPASVQQILTTYVQASDISPTAAQILRQRDAHRPTSV